MTQLDIQSKLQALATKFTEEIVAIFGEAFASVASDLAVAAPSKGKAASKKGPAKSAPRPVAAPKAAKKAPAGKKAPAAKPVAAAKPGKRIRRSEDQLLADGERVIKLLSANKKGLRIEQINKQLGTATKQLARPILKLLEEGKIKKSGEKRATIYFSA